MQLTKKHAIEVYPESVNEFEDSVFFMAREPEKDYLVVVGEHAADFDGEKLDCSVAAVKAPLTHANATSLKKCFPFTAPVRVLGKKRSFGLGDRLGIATPGHIRLFKEYDAYPVFAQQSIRELNLTQRTYEDVLDAATFYTFRDGYKDGYGADGDHLKTEADIEYALSLGFTMLTLDCSEHIRSGVEKMTDEEVDKAVTLTDEYKKRYLSAPVRFEDVTITFTENSLKRAVLIYADAIKFASHIYDKYLASGKYDCDFEISIDETATPTEPAQHYFVANELIARGVSVQTVAPRFCGEFQKGIDYIGDIAQFEKELKIHAAIARHFGYKLSIHSGSDKFATFALIGKYTQGNFHVKTAGTNWLEAMRAVAKADPALYREIHKYALTMFDEACKYYHVTTDLNNIPDVDGLLDGELEALFDNNDARQLIHITYGFILTDKAPDGKYIFKDKLYKFWRENEGVYAEMLYKHIGKHLSLLYGGFEN
ncbi:MAG: tagaturonate epimerase family protein [Clostridia bacterium]|nr:tagaturonate epimerase family protein [Clostridia bacterium]